MHISEIKVQYQGSKMPELKCMESHQQQSGSTGSEREQEEQLKLNCVMPGRKRTIQVGNHRSYAEVTYFYCFCSSGYKMCWLHLA